MACHPLAVTGSRFKAINSRKGQPGCCPFQPESEMDAKARDLALLGAVSLFCAIFAWAFDRDVWGSVFFALGVIGILGAAYRRWP
jgi:hypothetical protein